MRRPRHMAQMKEQNKTPEKEITKGEISSLIKCRVKILVAQRTHWILQEHSKDPGRNEG